MCVRVEIVRDPVERVESSDEVTVICVKPEAVSSWLELAQALYYAYHWRGPARNPAVSALMYLAQNDQIREAVKVSAVGGAEAICAALGPREALAARKPLGEPYLPEGRWDPWKVTRFALDLVA